MNLAGNLELRTRTDTIYGSSTQEGNQVYQAIQMLASFLHDIRNPSDEQYKDWFRKTARKLLPFQHKEALADTAFFEVIIDTSRRLVIYDADDGEVSDSAIARLCKYRYQNWRYFNPLKKG